MSGDALWNRKSGDFKLPRGHITHMSLFEVHIFKIFPTLYVIQNPFSFPLLHYIYLTKLLCRSKAFLRKEIDTHTRGKSFWINRNKENTGNRKRKEIKYRTFNLMVILCVNSHMFGEITELLLCVSSHIELIHTCYATKRFVVPDFLFANFRLKF